MKFLALVPLWLASVSWHLWRVLTMRPAFKYLSDTALPVLSVSLVFMAVGLIRHVGFGSEGLLGAFFEQTVFGLVLCLLAERRGRSSSLTVAYLSASAVVDIFTCCMFAAGLLKTPQLPLMAGGIWQVALMVAAYAQFHREPAEVQTTGYRPNGKASVFQS